MGAAPRPVVLRCGLPRPVELTPTSALLEVNGVRWLQLDDGGPGPRQLTYVAVDRPVYVARDHARRGGSGPLQAGVRRGAQRVPRPGWTRSIAPSYSLLSMATLSRATEDYLKAVYHVAHRGKSVTTGLLASELGVSSPSVSAMVRRLEEAGLLLRADSRSFRLTEDGERAALRVVRRHRLLETFLASMLDVPWDEVHAEAELLEHAVSDRLEERIDAALGHPTHDPHGDPIPPGQGPHDEGWSAALDSAPAGCRFRVDRVSDRDSAALRYLGEMGVIPGVVVDVEEQEPFGGPRWVRVSGERRSSAAPSPASSTATSSTPDPTPSRTKLWDQLRRC